MTGLNVLATVSSQPHDVISRHGRTTVRRMNHRLVNSIKMWEGNGSTTTLFFLNGLPEVKCSGGKLVSHSDVRVKKELLDDLRNRIIYCRGGQAP
jgi:hypothetical protein